MPAILMVIEAPPRGLTIGARLVLADGEHVIGRGRRLELCIGADPAAARHHARLVVAGDEVTIFDCGSTNGVVIDGRRIGRASVPVGCEFLLGSTLLRRVPPDAAIDGT